MSDSSADIAVVFGTRPEIIKLAPILSELGLSAEAVFTGQHYDPSLTDVFFDNFGIARPSAVLDTPKEGSRSARFSAILSGLVSAFAARPPKVVVVQGDTDSTSAGAQAGKLVGARIVHVEAGLRSGDRAMPEELNRQVVGVLADAHCAATWQAADNLARIGVDWEAIRVTGNTIVEATLHSIPGRAATDAIIGEYGLDGRPFAVATVHRPENTDDPERLDQILRALGALDVPVVLPAHPRLLGRAEAFGRGEALRRLHVIAPVDHPTFLALISRARLVVSDSGGVQEEVTVLKKPLVVIRNNTERPEAIASGFARLVTPGPDLAHALAAALGAADSHERLRSVPSPFGDGKAGVRIARLATALAEDGRLPSAELARQL